MNEFIGFIAFVIGAILIITFFVIAYRLGRIVDDLDDLRYFELQKPENQKQIKCQYCGGENIISILKQRFRCLKCNKLNKL